ncbi:MULTISPECIES: hydroxyisourate hydrolase [Thermomonosporaceae]|uniref:hydroxyisourate hydrolase n=1 Tax=Thermomonosporaceae TaxID=2012 RepID=UPI00255AA0B8|nr:MULTISPECIES: hydroxyisourate hydrolase [Thermomonosporaceae]MDL4771291.1 hydroxyisourate hydrolase [Actinomadura xylanilytica]
MTVSTHVLDTHRGSPAPAVPVRLDRHDGESWRPVQEGETDGRGRWTAAGGAGSEPGTYRLRFGTGPYFSGIGTDTYYPEVVVVFTVPAGSGHHHVPLLLSPFGYSTYRGD